MKTKHVQLLENPTAEKSYHRWQSYTAKSHMISIREDGILFTTTDGNVVRFFGSYQVSVEETEAK